MSYSVKHKIKDGILYIESTGTVSEEEFEKISFEMMGIAMKLNPQKVIINSLGLKGRLSLFKSLENINSIPEELKKIKTAIVEPKEYASFYTDYKVFTKNRNIPIRFFNTVEDAEGWLK